jgi:lysine N6-hydroxylase/mycobactin lysine-N-oxygenase
LEFEQYLAWCASKLNSVNYSQAVHRVEFKAEGWFELATQTQIYAAKHISIGVGRVPYCGGINTIEDDRLFHSSDYLFNRERIERGNRVVVIGGGQSAADIVEDLLNNSDAGIEWITRRDSVYELDDSAFSNLWYTPAYHKHFFGCIASERERVIGSQRLSSDAISKHTIDNIYNMSYRRIIEGDYRFRIVPSSTVSDVVLGESGGSLTVRSRKSGSSAESATFADFVILATGYRRRSPPFLYELLESVKNGKDHHEMMDDFSIRIGGNKIYLLNSEEIVHGIAEKNLSLVAYRSRRVLNSLREIDTDGGDMTGSLVTW